MSDSSQPGGAGCSEESIFLAALEIADSEEQARYLDEACGRDESLRAAVELLLRCHRKGGGSFLEEPAAVALRSPGADAGAQDALSWCGFPEPVIAPGSGSPGEKEGEQIGHYKLLELIGEGGFGRVWMAAQTEPVQRRVALKIVKLGMDTGEVLARFEAERQALAMMDHPHIAHVFDGGATETGRPYFVMELVRGVPITDYCDANKLPPRDRVELFEKVCRAVQHAHQKGIIHRDLKPSNILVTVQDDRPLPKVIDFGVAKALQTRLTERTLFTRFNQWIGTPAYMSPEQAGLGSLDVDVRSDIYSLGTILYELLTGNTPFDHAALREEGYEAMLRTIREEDPPRPSTRLSSLPREDLHTVANHRSESPEKLGREIRGELDWILLKTLDRDRTRRYDTANALANDLGRYAAGDPISAAPPTLAYRAGKVIRKHWKAATITASFGLLIIATAVASTVLAIRENRAAARATRAEGIAGRQKELAIEQRDLARTNYYVAGIARSWRDWQVGNVNRTAETLMDFVPRDDAPDQRGWEWYYLASLLEEDENVLQPNLGPIRGVTFSPDGKLLVVAGEGVAIYDRQTKRLLRALPGQAPIAWRPNHRQLATVTKEGGHGEATLWDIDTGEARQRIRYGWISCLSWRPDGRALALGGQRKFAIWEEGMDVPKVHPHPRPDNPHDVGSMAWSPDGNLLAMAFGYPGQIQLWSAEDRRLREAMDIGADTSVGNLDWSTANGQLAHGAGGGYLYCWDLETHEKVPRIPYAHAGNLSALAWSPNGNRLATGGDDQLVKVWTSGKEGRLVTQFGGHRGQVKSLAWTPDGSSIASGAADGSVRLWVPERSQAGMALSGSLTMAWSPDGRKMATLRIGRPNEPVSHDSLLIYDARTGVLEREMDIPGPAGGGDLVWSPDGGFLGAVRAPCEVQIWDTRSGQLVHRLTDIHVSRFSDCRCIAWSPDSTEFATCGQDRRIKIWETADGELLRTLEGHEAAVGTVRWSPDGCWFMSTDWNRQVKIWDAASWQCLWDLRQPQGPDTGGGDGTYSAAWSPDSRRLATRSGVGGLAVWELAAGQSPRRVWSVRAHSAAIRSVDWSPDGRRIASGSEDSLLKIWDAATGRELLSFDHRSWVPNVAWSPDGTRLAAATSLASANGSVILIRDTRKALGVNWEERLEEMNPKGEHQ